MHLVGFVIRIYHDARSAERHILSLSSPLDMYSEKFVMMDRGTVRNMWSFIPKINMGN